jgi:hypothetical protein
VSSRVPAKLPSMRGLLEHALLFESKRFRFDHVPPEEALGLVVEIFLKEEHRRCADALVFQEMATCWLRCLVFVLEQVTVARCV